MWQIIVAQTVGAVLGVLIVYFGVTRDDVSSVIYPKIFLMCPPRIDNPQEIICDGSGYQWQTFLCELITNFVFVSVVMALKYQNLTDSTAIGAFAGCVTLHGMLRLAAGISGACLNPTVALV